MLLMLRLKSYQKKISFYPLPDGGPMPNPSRKVGGLLCCMLMITFLSCIYFISILQCPRYCPTIDLILRTSQVVSIMLIMTRLASHLCFHALICPFGRRHIANNSTTHFGTPRPNGIKSNDILKTPIRISGGPKTITTPLCIQRQPSSNPSPNPPKTLAPSHPIPTETSK